MLVLAFQPDGLLSKPRGGSDLLPLTLMTTEKTDLEFVDESITGVILSF